MTRVGNHIVSTTGSAPPATGRSRWWSATWVGLSLLLGGCLVDFTGPGGDPDATPFCGNGLVDDGEGCDGENFGGLTCQTMGSEMGELGCTSACELDLSGCHSCGNGELDGAELCDDGNGDAGDGCLGCQLETGWFCSGEPSVCESICGDGIVASDEPCDDGNIAGGDGCSAECLVEAGWVCTGSPSECFETCGDGVADPGEGCDDGNLVAGDGCAPGCQVEDGWSCDGVPSICDEVCGDGLVVGAEVCDDGNTATGDGCGASCSVEQGWDCDFDGCVPICGDGLVVGDEACDDGDPFGGDGCDGSCNIEPYSACDGEPSVCVCVVYVNIAATPATHTGADWGSAYTYMESALQEAQSRGACEVWVAEGTYYTYYSGSGNRLELHDDMALYGGFAGTETWRNQRDPVARVTVISGEQEGNPANQVRTVMRASGAQRVILDGFTVTRGSTTAEKGGGLRLVSGSEVSVRSCRFVENTGEEGGGIFVEGSTIEVLDTEFVDNVAEQRGGGLHLQHSATGTVEGCLFQGNTTLLYQGGGISADTGSALTVTSSRFYINEAINWGGGIRSNDSSLSVVNSVFWGNSAPQGGGGISVYLATPPTPIVNCTFLGNTSSPGQGASVRVGSDDVQIYNCILWGTTTDQVVLDTGGSADVQNCNVYGGASGIGNIDAEPLFTAPVFGDHTLSAGSPCIDAANGTWAPATDIAGLARVDDPNTTPNTGTGTPDYADMGAYEYQP